MPMYNLIEYSDACMKKSKSYCNTLELNIIDFPPNKNNSISFKFKQLTGQAGND